MTRVNRTQLTVDEIVASLRNSLLPTLLVEGKSDMNLLRLVESECFSGAIDILPAGSRDQLFSVYKRRGEFANLDVAFLADADMFVFSEIPQGYENIVFTQGYSIENDVLSGGKAFNVVSIRHRAKWSQILGALSYWFGSIVHRYLSHEAVDYKAHPSQIVDFESTKINGVFRDVIIEEANLSTQASVVLRDPIRYLRGHTLIDAIGHFLAHVKQRPKCDKEFLLYLDVVAWAENEALSRIISEVKNRIGTSL